MNYKAKELLNLMKEHSEEGVCELKQPQMASMLKVTRQTVNKTMKQLLEFRNADDKSIVVREGHSYYFTTEPITYFKAQAETPVAEWTLKNFISHWNYCYRKTFGKEYIPPFPDEEQRFLLYLNNYGWSKQKLKDTIEGVFIHAMDTVDVDKDADIIANYQIHLF